MKKLGIVFVILLAFAACSNENVIDLSKYNFSDVANQSFSEVENIENVTLINNSEVVAGNESKLDDVDVNSSLNTVVGEVETVLDGNMIVENISINEETDVLNYKEGDKIILNPKVNDPDGDKVDVIFYAPFNSTGIWDTKLGDAGMHEVVFTITDGTYSQNVSVNIFIQKKNRAPILEEINDIVVKEGQIINIEINVSDEENDNLNITYEGFMTGDKYQTTFLDAGEYDEKITVEDGYNIVESSFKIIIEDVNQAPVFTGLSQYNLKENETIDLSLSFEDIDDDEIKYELPEELEDEKFYAQIGAIGVQTFDLKFSDGVYNKTEELTFVVEDINFAPILLKVNDEEYSKNLTLTFKEGESASIEVISEDYDEDKLSYSYSGFFKSNSKTIDFDSAGNYVQKIIVSDGTVSTAYEFNVVVENVNRAPEFLGFE